MKKLLFAAALSLCFGAVCGFSQTKTTVSRRVINNAHGKRRVIIKRKIIKKRRIIKRKTMSEKQSSAVTTASGLTYIITDHGTGEQLKTGDNVIINYTGLLTNGVKFDSSIDRNEPFSFPLGAGRVIKGWDEGVGKLRVGDRATLIIPSSLGYGASGAGGVIPPNATLIFIVEVMGVK